MKLGRKLKMGMIGGGPGAFIGDVHRKAARMDGGIELVAGAFDIVPKKSKQMGREQNLGSLWALLWWAGFCFRRS